MIAKFGYSFALGNLAPLHMSYDNPNIHNHILFSTNLFYLLHMTNTFWRLIKYSQKDSSIESLMITLEGI